MRGTPLLTKGLAVAFAGVGGSALLIFFVLVDLPVPWALFLLTATVLVVLAEGSYLVWDEAAGSSTESPNEFYDRFAAFVVKTDASLPESGLAAFMLGRGMSREDRARMTQERGAEYDRARRRALVEYHEAFREGVLRRLSQGDAPEAFLGLARDPKISDLDTLRDALRSIADGSGELQ